MRSPLKAFLLLPFIFLLVQGCKKESFTTNRNALLSVSVDSLRFDTVFTSTGSVSHFFKIINENDKGIVINSVKMGGGTASPFKMNVDGVPGPQVSNVEIAAGDSIYVYVTVSINPTAADLPFIITDSIEAYYNGNILKVQLEAFGQNAHFFRNKIITTSENWNNDLPYVILGSLTIAPNATLTINKGSRIFIHADAPVLVHGSLQVFGEEYDSTRVVFAGDRLDLPYRNFPGSYPGLIFTETSRNNILRYAIIKNAYQGIVLLEPAAGTKLQLEQTIIDNAYDAGILALNSSIRATNLLVSNCGKNILIVKGGDYQFDHCTVVSYTTAYGVHKEPVLTVSNFISQNNVAVTAPLQAVFNNCIFWGESGGLVNSEVVVLKQGTTAHQVQFNNVLWKVPSDPANATVTGNNIKNISPAFDSINISSRYFSFRPAAGSPALDKGSPIGISVDLDGKPRPVGLPDLGAYERQ